MTNGELMISTIENTMGVKFDDSFNWKDLDHDVVIAFDGSWWRDKVKLCDVVNSCEECPRYADDCDGKGEDDELT